MVAILRSAELLLEWLLLLLKAELVLADSDFDPERTDPLVKLDTSHLRFIGNHCLLLLNSGNTRHELTAL